MRTEFRSPHDLEAERSVLGAILLDGKRLTDVADVVQPEDFFRDAHQRIYRHLLKLSERGAAIDYVPLRDSLERAQELDAVDGPAYLTGLVDGMPHGANVAAYAGIVREHAIRRQMLKAAQGILEQAASAELDAAALLEDAQSRVWAIAMGQPCGDLVSVGTLVRPTIEALEALAAHRGGVVGVPTGLADLDGILHGLRPSNLVLLAARPAMGKSALAMNVAAHAAGQGHRVAVFSLEMSKEELMFRLAAGEARVNLQRLTAGRLSESEYGRLSAALATFDGWPLHVDESGLLTVSEIRAKCRRLQAQAGLGLVIVDYLQLMYDGKKHDSRVLELAAISRGLKQLAKELRVPVLALSQLSREVERRNPKRPMLSDLRDSGALEQDADVVLLLWRAEEYEATPENQGQAEVIIAKHRNGATGAVTLKFFAETTTFANYSRH